MYLAGTEDPRLLRTLRLTLSGLSSIACILLQLTFQGEPKIYSEPFTLMYIFDLSYCNLSRGGSADMWHNHSKVMTKSSGFVGCAGVALVSCPFSWRLGAYV